VLLDKPLKRLTTYPVDPNPKLKLGENEKVGFRKSFYGISDIKIPSAASNRNVEASYPQGYLAFPLIR
jgi:hypothetical protein